MIYQSTGIIRYNIDNRVGYKVVIEIDQGIADYYRSFIPKYRNVQRQAFPAHISIVRKATPTKLDSWGKYEGVLTDFMYENIIDNCPTYHWIHAFTTLGETIREELGLPVYDGNDVPSGYRQRFHVTLGNCK